MSRMAQEKGLRVWAYARDINVHPNMVISQMSQLLERADQKNLPVVGTSQDISSGMTLERMGLLTALRATRTRYANALLVRDVSRLSEDRHILLRIIEILQEHDAVLLCTAEDAHASLQAKGFIHNRCASGQTSWALACRGWKRGVR